MAVCKIARRNEHCITFCLTNGHASDFGQSLYLDVLLEDTNGLSSCIAYYLFIALQVAEGGTYYVSLVGEDRSEANVANQTTCQMNFKYRMPTMYGLA